MRKPVQVSIYVDEGCWAGVAILIKELLVIAGTLHSRNFDLDASALFQITLAGPSEAAVRSFTGTMITPDQAIRNSGPPPQVIVIPPYYFFDAQAVPVRANFRRWLVRAYERGAILLGFDGGVRVLAASGLLDGHEVTGNLSDQKAFAQHYSPVRFSPHVPLVTDGRIVTATGTAPSMDACAYLVNHFYGEAAAHKFSRYTNPVRRPVYERTELIDVVLKNHADHRIRQAQEFIERHFNQDISVEDAARRAAMSLRNFTRRFHTAVGMTALNYISHCRVEHAKKMLELRGGPVLQVALECGFNNEASFRRAFHQICEQTPMQYRKASMMKKKPSATP
ncbi:GlxA family transcriptional regulator [Undibacterium terreum]|uniref:AraC family transcriptional regulator n=1 Tax=Undibacterium terreum TaxID=1224302 RepID=A0A916XMF3_9BURK|nr:helix-turn-helix domain-containing protein [Undibacterium terreum]GGC84163.1 AraC family transcriptional regulator [Undibacterium terreum]